MTQTQETSALISGIKCDNPKCNYTDPLVKYEEYPEYVNKPCPECGSNLLTEQDYEMCKTMIEDPFKAMMSLMMNEDLSVNADGINLDSGEDVTALVKLNLNGEYAGPELTIEELTDSEELPVDRINKVAHLLPVEALQDILKRMTDWKASGGGDNDSYMHQQARYAENLANALQKK